VSQTEVALSSKPSRTARTALFAIVFGSLILVSALALAQFAWPSGPGAVQEFYVTDLPDQAYATRFLVTDGIPIWLVRQPNGGARAFWAHSPHRGCDVEYASASSSIPDVSY